MNKRVWIIIGVIIFCVFILVSVVIFPIYSNPYRDDFNYPCYKFNFYSNECINVHVSQCRDEDSYDSKEECEKDNSLLEICPTGHFYNNKTCECPQGYSRSRTVSQFGSLFDYCKLNKEWEEFKDCSPLSECEERERCIARIENRTNYKCIPLESYELDCGCNIEDEGICWCYQ